MNSAVLANDTNEYINDEVVMEASTLSEVIDEDDTMVDHKRNVALFILKPRVMYKIPQVHLESLLADLSEIIENKVCEATKKLNDAVLQNDTHLPNNNFLMETLTKNLSNLFSGLETTYLQKTFFQNNFRIVVSNHHYLHYLFLPSSTQNLLKLGRH